MRKLFLLGALFLFGCGGSTSGGGASGGQAGAGSGGTSGSGATGGSGGSGGTSVGGSGGIGGCESLVPCCDASGNPVNPVCNSGSPACPPGSAFPPTGICTPTNTSCTPQKPCAADEWCDYNDNLCGAGEPGSCKKRPQGCDLMYAPICACDGSVAGNECAAQSGGSDVNGKGGCKPPQAMFACGQIFCSVAQQYCERATSDVGGWPDSYSCKTLPAACATAPSCGCLMNEPCGTLCEGDSMGNLTVTCPGG